MVDQIEIGHLKIPNLYEKAIRKVLKTLGTSSMLTSIATYKNLNETAKEVGLRLNTIEDVDDDFVTQNTIFLSQARYLARIAKNSPDEVKPILYHYAEQSLYGFFVYSLFHYDKASSHHGIGMNWNDLTIENLSLTIKKYGFFNRILDAYCLLHERKFKFSPFVQNNSTIEKNDDDDSFSNRPELNLEKIVNLRQERHNPPGLETDIIDFLMLFYSSSLARYKPFLWKKITDGKSSGEMFSFNQCFSRFDILYKRLLTEICYIHNQRYVGICLGMFDIQLESEGHLGLQ